MFYTTKNGSPVRERLKKARMSGVVFDKMTK